MDDGDFPGECLSGSIDFERIVVQRRPNAPITTDIVACLQCRAMYFVPMYRRASRRSLMQQPAAKSRCADARCPRSSQGLRQARAEHARREGLSGEWGLKLLDEVLGDDGYRSHLSIHQAIVCPQT